MKESHGEGVASHAGPESCVGAREGAREALTGGGTGWALSREIHDSLRGADAVEEGGRLSRRRRYREALADPARQRPRARAQAPRTGTGRARVRLWLREPQTASGSPRTHADDGRARAVGPLRSTGEAAEQGRGAGRGGGGGKGAGQGELGQARRAPDTGPGRRAQCARPGASGSRTGQE